MSRSGYTDDYGDDDPLRLYAYRGMVASATRGKRGQRFFRDLIAALDAMPEKKLCAYAIQKPTGEVCAVGAVAMARGVDMSDCAGNDEDFSDEIADEYAHAISTRLDIADCLAREVQFENDECGPWDETDEQRWHRMRRWAAAQIKEPSHG